MRTSIPSGDLSRYVARMLNNSLPDGVNHEKALKTVISVSLERVEHCFSQIHRKYYTQPDGCVFDHLHSDHMATLLYFLSNQSVMADYEPLGSKLAYLNKIMHGIDLYPHVQLPEVFLLLHPVGTILGRATYGNFLVVYQGVTVGATSIEYPIFGDGTVLFSGAKVLGAARSGNNVVFGANTMVIEGTIPDDSTVVGQHPFVRVHARTKSVREAFFGAPGPDAM